ncbi:Similar to cep152: Centrosomal protein of 152 kDa (Xenopus laevis) [Cotesia congregata]|uniref:Similar to cep152: Centrosomal protein of 152 kDa (Xenopus laevis) n=1 Tax=Cotesia congregata TaxID=51543 RepID=A0A8J2HFZ0_COTCN|nr:Similar to cep152: Centrosomal protein of 152 kDa (Xenopus laevis) [Cotesia congregata]
MQDRGVGSMEAPGMSLFQGSDSIKINSIVHRQEEDEEQEDLKRRDEEIKDLLTNAFEDLDEDDEVSSVNSSNFHESRDLDPNNSNSLINNRSKNQINNDKAVPTLSHYQKEFGMYTSDGKAKYAMSTPYYSGKSNSKMQCDFDMYGQIGTPRTSNRDNHSLNSIPENSFELPRAPSLTSPMTFPNDLRAQINDGYTFVDNYPSNYETPSNHFDTQNAKYSNNGYLETYDNNNPLKNITEVGSGDHDDSSDHYNHCYKTSPNGRPAISNDTNAYKTAEYNSKEQLEVLYSVRVREIERLTEEVQQLQLEKEEEKNQLSRKLALAQSEIERSNLSRNQAQNALIDAKAEIAQLQGQIETFKEKITVLEKTNKNLSDELKQAKNSVVDLQQKIAVLERVQSLQANDRTHEKFLKQAQEKHSIEMKNMQTQIDLLTDKLNEKESMYVSLEHKLAEVRRAHETLMVEKGDTMNRLSKALEESQVQCRNLMATNNAQEIMQLQNRVKILTEEKEEVLKTVQELKHKLDVAKSDALQYDSLLTSTMEEESDSIRQMKLGELHNKSRNKSGEDIMNKLRGELQRCIAGQAIKRKEITRLENTLSQKDKELEKACARADSCQQEAARYAKRVTDLEHELKSFISDRSIKVTNQIRKLTENLTEVREQNATLMQEKTKLQEKLEETLASQEETIRKIQHETMAQQEKEIIGEFNKEYLEIHDKAVERARQEAHLEIVQLTVQLEQTQRELDRVKELYIEVCGTKEQLINEHKEEIKTLRETYASLESQKQEIDYVKLELEAQIKITQRLTGESESYKKKIIELEKDLSYERKKKVEYTRKIHEEIERAKEEALAELRNAHPERQISILLPDHCSEHSDKISQLESDCKRLEEKLSSAVEEQQKMSELQKDLDGAKIKIAQMEIAHETLKRKYSNIVNEKNDLLVKLSRREHQLSDSKHNSDNKEANQASVSAKINLENNTLKSLCENLMKDKIGYQTRISELENQLVDCKNKIMYYENNISRSHESLSNTRNDLEKELNQYKELVRKLTDQLNNSKDGQREDMDEQRVKQLELELQEKEAQLQRLKDLEKIKEERDSLITKLKNQAKQFEEYVKNQKQISAELNLSPRSTLDTNDLQRMREMSIKTVREEMEQKVAEELRMIEDQHRVKEKTIEERYKNILSELNLKYAEKTKELEAMKEVMLTEKIKLQSSFKAQEQIVTQMIEQKITEYKQELLARKLTIENLQGQLRQKELDHEEAKNSMAQIMSTWAAENQEMKDNKSKMQEEINKLKEAETKFTDEINRLKLKEKEMKNIIDTIKHKYQSAKTTAQNYKEYAEQKEKFLMGECKRIEDGYKKAINQVQQNVDEIVSTQELQMKEKLKELESQYEEKLRQTRHKIKYKDKR